MEKKLLERLENLERKQLNLKITLMITLCSFALFFILAFSNRDHNNNDIIKTKGIVIVDNNGKLRIILGAPVSKVSGRIRTDDLYGISYLDASGIDRLTFGQEPAPMTPEGLKERRVPGVGILIHAKQGIEREEDMVF